MAIIYLLRDPRNGKPRYIGVTSGRLAKRLADHRNDKRRTHRTAWFQLLSRLGLKPIAEILEHISEKDRGDSERAWILGFRQSGADLVNATDGGEGTPGIKRSKENRDNMRLARLRMPIERRRELSSQAAKARKGYHHSSETIEKIRSSNLGKPHPKHTEERKRRQSERSRNPKNIEHLRQQAIARRGIKRPQHVIDALIKANTGKLVSQETRKRMSESKKGIKPSIETKKKMSLSLKRYWSERG